MESTRYFFLSIIIVITVAVIAALLLFGNHGTKYYADEMWTTLRAAQGSDGIMAESKPNLFIDSNGHTTDYSYVAEDLGISIGKFDCSKFSASVSCTNEPFSMTFKKTDAFQARIEAVCANNVCNVTLEPPRS